MKIIKQKYEHRISDNFEIEVRKEYETNYNLYIVYYINCELNENYFTWIQNQINIVINYTNQIYLMCTINLENEEILREKIKKYFNNDYIVIICNSINEHEYPGINKVWELGQKHNKDNDIIMYFHSKGITRCKDYNESIPLLTDAHNCEKIIKDINLIYEIFSLFPSIYKITTTCGGFGWGWYNYWIARGSYINHVEKPIKTQRRHYYEDWLFRKLINDDIKNLESNNNENLDFSLYENTLKNCYQIYTENNTGNIGYFMDLRPGIIHTDIYIIEQP